MKPVGAHLLLHHPDLHALGEIASQFKRKAGKVLGLRNVTHFVPYESVPGRDVSVGILVVASIACLKIIFDDIDRFYLRRLGAGSLKIENGRDQQTETRRTDEKNRWPKNFALFINHFFEVGVECSHLESRCRRDFTHSRRIKQPSFHYIEACSCRLLPLNRCGSTSANWIKTDAN